MDPEIDRGSHHKRDDTDRSAYPVAGLQSGRRWRRELEQCKEDYGVYKSIPSRSDGKLQVVEPLRHDHDH